MWQTALLLGFALTLAACNGGGGTANGQTPPPPPAGFQSYGNSKITVRTVSHGAYNRTFLLRAKDRKSGAPVCGATVTVYGEMISPHLMTLIQHNVKPMKCGAYKGDYTFIMPGTWKANFVLRTKTGDASTASLPLKIGP